MNSAIPFDVDRFDKAMAAAIDGYVGPCRLEPLGGGQSNPTYLVETEGDRYVLRKKPAGALLVGAHQIEREFRVQSALVGEPGIPVPRMHWLCEDDSILGTPFYVMEHVEGRIVDDSTLPGFTAAERTAVYDDLAGIMARLHAVDVEAVGLRDYGRAGGYLGRLVRTWTRQYEAAVTHEIAAMDRLIDWFPLHLPADDEDRIVHGDIRIGNVILHPSEPRIASVLDWELSTIGDPWTDVALIVLPWYLPKSPIGDFTTIDPESSGIPSADEFLRRYCATAGRPLIDAADPAFAFVLALVLFRTASVMQGIASRHRNGTSTTGDGPAFGALVEPLADRAWAIVSQL